MSGSLVIMNGCRPIRLDTNDITNLEWFKPKCLKHLNFKILLFFNRSKFFHSKTNFQTEYLSHIYFFRLLNNAWIVFFRPILVAIWQPDSRSFRHSRTSNEPSFFDQNLFILSRIYRSCFFCHFNLPQSLKPQCPLDHRPIVQSAQSLRGLESLLDAPFQSHR